MEFQLLGPVEARDGGRHIALSGSKVHTVLAVLLLARGRVVSDGRLSELLWGWDPPVTMSAQIYTYISRLRKLLGPGVRLVRRQPGYQLIADGALVDVAEFERLERLGQRALEEQRYTEAAESLRNALDLWQGSALANVTPFLAEAELPRLEEARVNALEHRIEADLALGRHEGLVSELTGLVSEFPVRERLRAQLMTALYRCGRQAEAMHSYHEGRQVLAEELGVDPGADLTDTYQAVLSGGLTRPAPGPTTGLAARATAGPTAVPGAAAPPVMIPPAIADFTGREREFADLCAQLAPAPAHRRSAFRARRLVITGMAGVGKTTLAVQVAHAVAGDFPDGLLHARLHHDDRTVKDSGAVLTQLLRALGETDDVLAPGGRQARLDDLVRRYRTRTAGRRLLIVLDDAAGDLQLDALLPATADAAVLITSRNRLPTVPGSRTVSLEPMGTGESLALVAAIAGGGRITAEPEAVHAVVEACAGLPLALRTVATRLAARPHRPAARLARRLADPTCRFEELRVGGLDVGRTLASALRGRPARERELIGRLAPYGGESLTASDAALLLGLSEEVAEEFLERLVEGSLLELDGIDTAGEPRYRFHELTRLVAVAQQARPLSRAS
ncbi:DNA-binding SARP family transcriptional activator [Streptomyces umbrinus]|uniref:DNA-binding SARP family transcriptional activator n=1 Tax=Streptomyces umbrinus TaxID=67370 RepID=A0ABU0STR1_9ACTN|nr:AfsR/SARP family transcriptional regulator [Streptomyces umbrinus]MDQ1026928.1 DNA-binding SARP family transcriptional activator [Streptomyces umbrinus]